MYTKIRSYSISIGKDLDFLGVPSNGFLNSLNIKVVLNIFQAVVRGLEFYLLPLPKLYLTPTFKNKKKARVA